MMLNWNWTNYREDDVELELELKAEDDISKTAVISLSLSILPRKHFLRVAITTRPIFENHSIGGSSRKFYAFAGIIAFFAIRTAVYSADVAFNRSLAVDFDFQSKF